MDEKKETTPRRAVSPIDKDKELKALQAAANNLRLLEVRLSKLLSAQRDALMTRTKDHDGEPKLQPAGRR